MGVVEQHEQHFGQAIRTACVRLFPSRNHFKGCLFVPPQCYAQRTHSVHLGGWPLGQTGDIVVDRQIGGGSFGGVFAGSWNGMQVILKRANVRPPCPNNSDLHLYAFALS
jgi:hypothetical protein